ncbi:hypothetical protein EC968_007021 [Mortierella alpina]|nr:hypothetical protein EC968_007021 [Mortierella alpina]
MASHRNSAQRRRMDEWFPWLRGLWYLLVVGASITLICDIAFLSLRPELIIYVNAGLALIADCVTVFVFAYFIWGRDFTEPLLAFSATSAPWKRYLRVFGSCFLIVLWVLVRSPTVAGLGFGIVLAVEMVVSYRIGSIQRDLVLRGHGWEEKPVADHPAAGTTVSRNSWESMDREEASAHAVEIVRPPEVNVETTIKRLQMDSYLMQFQRQQQLHLHQTWQQEHGEGGEPGKVQEELQGATEVKGEEEVVTQDGKSQLDDQDDPLKESSFKFEVPMDTPLEAAAAESSTLVPLESARTVHSLLHPPSALSLSRSTVVECHSDQTLKDSS